LRSRSLNCDIASLTREHEPMIKFSGEAVTDKVQKGVGFSGENEEVMRSPSLTSDIANLTQSLWANVLMDDT